MQPLSDLGGRAELELPDGTVTLRASALPPPFVWHYSAQTEVRADQIDPLLTLQPRLWWPWWAGLGLGALALAGRWWQLRWQRLRESMTEASDYLPRNGRPPQGRVGGCRCLEVIGQGAMGVVYRAESADGTPCAIKVPFASALGSDAQRRALEREAELVWKLRHPALVRCQALSLGERPYLQLEWVEGATLEALPPEASSLAEWHRCRAWAQQILEVLVYLHGQGVVHRDLKPANVMIQPNGRVKVMDLGIAALLQPGTSADARAGTLDYMAPEQVVGAPSAPADDLYPLGVMLYERLCRKLPFSGEPTARMGQKLEHELPPLHEQAPELPLPVCLWVAHLARRRREDRPLDAAEALISLPS